LKVAQLAYYYLLACDPVTAIAVMAGRMLASYYFLKSPAFDYSAESLYYIVEAIETSSAPVEFH